MSETRAQEVRRMLAAHDPRLAMAVDYIAEHATLEQGLRSLSVLLGHPARVLTEAEEVPA
jgi:hypothetical protein